MTPSTWQIHVDESDLKPCLQILQPGGLAPASVRVSCFLPVPYGGHTVGCTGQKSQCLQTSHHKFRRLADTSFTDGPTQVSGPAVASITG